MATSLTITNLMPQNPFRVSHYGVALVISVRAKEDGRQAEEILVVGEGSAN